MYRNNILPVAKEKITLNRPSVLDAHVGIIRLAMRSGATATELAKYYNVWPSTVWRFLQRHEMGIYVAKRR